MQKGATLYVCYYIYIYICCFGQTKQFSALNQMVNVFLG